MLQFKKTKTHNSHPSQKIISNYEKQIIGNMFIKK